MLVFEDVEGRHPATPWQPDELDRVVEALEALAESLTPSPVGSDVAQTVESWLMRNGQGWNRMLEDPLPGRDEWSIASSPSSSPSSKVRRRTPRAATPSSTSTPAPTTCS